jgi:hypothetical protein
MDQEIDAIDLDDELDVHGATRVSIGSWKKEADCCWAPALDNIQPTLVLEIGLSESFRRLRIDARGWLETKGSSVNAVILIKISRDEPRITVQYWGLSPRQYTIATRASPALASCAQEITISHDSNVTTGTGDLTLPFEEVVGRARNPSTTQERGFVIHQKKTRRNQILIHRVGGNTSSKFDENFSQGLPRHPTKR